MVARCLVPADGKKEERNFNRTKSEEVASQQYVGGPAYQPSLTSRRVTLPKVERNTWPPQTPPTTSTHSRPVFLSILVSPRPTHTWQGAAHARLTSKAATVGSRLPGQWAGSGPTTLQDPPRDMQQLPKLTGNLDGGSSGL